VPRHGNPGLTHPNPSPLAMVNLLDYDLERLTGLMAQLGEKPFRARQLLKWIHQYGADDFGAMTDLAKGFREKLSIVAAVSPPSLLKDSAASDGTRKWLLSVGSGNAVEVVFIPEQERGTLCVSSQVGCAMACTFCATGRQGLNRNLTAGEILGQLWWANKALGAVHKHDRAVSNVVFMGMGEPLLNLDNVIPALHVMLDDHAYGLSRRRVTVSTSGIVPNMDRLREECPVALAVSLHAPDDGLRDELVPINRKYPLRELLAACRRYLDAAERAEPPSPAAGTAAARKWQRAGAPRDFITFEYVLLDGVNDQPRHARELVALAADVPCKFNLIPFNPFPESGYGRSAPDAVRRFRDILMRAGRIATERRTRGDDIDAACGQLAGQVRERARRRAAEATS